LSPFAQVVTTGRRVQKPDDRFWHLQLIEGSWLIALALLLGAATIWLARRSH